ncbi:outer membrane beta-barrel protein [Aquibaculum arenosum]|uniref:Outer membrane beta-barrel protein n=1 Tax=Aquibaculum arenosum TaxID=3032591 RepID=A0ABT5YRD5_9PROT|nr:outer membrane beta-barrel protein [Fodinicurvata sp. CAU 1616]MDF2097535.1 outer membrane beta-barrel protein [Fodinicurvata sp. CAU 1616]
MTTSRIRVRVGASLLSAVMVALFCNAVSAQEEDIEEERGVPIYERSRPELEPLGLRAGAFMIRPSLSVGGEYNDNIYATKNNRESDFISRVTPNVSVQSDWSRHALSLDVGAEAGFYFDNSKENYIDGHAGLAGRIDLLRETYLEGHLSVQRRHEDRGDPDVPLANAEPSVYYEYNTGISAYRGVGRLSLRVGVDYTRYDYRAVDLTGGGSLSQSERDHNVYEAHTRVAYELLPAVIPYVEARYNIRRYDTHSGGNRDSHGYRVAIGTGFDAGGIITGSIFAGYMNQDYASNRQDGVSGPWFGGNVLWNITRLTSFELNLDRGVFETQNAAASSYTRSAVHARVDHELLRNLLVGGYGQYAHYEYNGVNISDEYVEAGPRITYLWNRNLTAELSASHRRKSSNRSGREYRSNQIMFMITGHL